MKVTDVVNNYMKANMIEVKGQESAEGVLTHFNAYLTRALENNKNIKTTLLAAGVTDLAICPDCKSHIVVEYGNCPFCGCNMLEAEEPKKEKKASKKKPEAKVEKESSEKPEKEKKTEKEEKVEKEVEPETKEVEEVKGNDEEEFEYPSSDVIMKMKKPDLLKLIEEHKDELAVDPKGMKIADLREAVDTAIGELYDEEVEDEEVLEVKEDEIDLDKVSESDLEDDDFDMGLDDDFDDFEE